MKGLILTYLLGYGGAAVALVNPLVGLFVYALFSIVRPQTMFSFAGNFGGMSEIVAVAMLAGWAMRGTGSWRLGRAWGAVILLLAFFVWHCISSIFAPYQQLAWHETTERAKAVAPFLVGVTLLTDRRWLWAFAWTLVLGSAYVAYEMNYAYYIGHYNRAQEFGLLGDNNSFAISQVAAIGPAMFLAFATDRWWKRAILLVCTAMMINTVFMTFSRGGMLGLIITGIVVLVVMPKRPGYLLGLILVVAIAARLAGPEVVTRFATTFHDEDERDTSAQSRVELWGNCIEVMARNPFFGIGPAHFPTIAAQFGWSEGKSPHTLWLETGAEVGVPGLAFFAGFFVWGMYTGLGLARKRAGPEFTALGLYVFSGLIGFAISAQFVSIQGLELPYYLVLVGAAAVRQSGEAREAGKAAAAVRAGHAPLVPAPSRG